MSRSEKLSHGLLAIALLVGALNCSSGSSPTEPPEALDTVVVGVMGCSQTSNAWRGWVATGDSRVWTPIQTYGGGDIADWASGIPSGDYWGRLEANIAANRQATAVWWQICDLERRNGTRAQADAILAEIRRRIPGARVFVSGLAEFESPETCSKQDIANSHTLADYVVSTGGAQPGPVLPMVRSEWIAPPAGDGGCHVGASGQAAFGDTLAAFPWG